MYLEGVKLSHLRVLLIRRSLKKGPYDIMLMQLSKDIPQRAKSYIYGKPGVA
jgi:hypothetical protein